MSFDLIMRLDDERLERVNGVEFDENGQIRLDKAVTVAQIREAADEGGAARLTFIVRRRRDEPRNEVAMTSTSRRGPGGYTP